MEAIKRKAATRGACALAFLSLAGVSLPAAELPSRRAAEKPVAKSCAAYGAGFVWAPSLNSCVKVGGSVQVEQSTTRR